MKERTDRGGIGLWLLILFVLVGLWACFQAGRLYFDHAALKNEVGAAAGEALTNPAGGPVQDRIMEILRNYGAEFDPAHLSVVFNDKGDRMTVAVPYTRQVDLRFTRFPLSFRVDLQQEAPKQAGVIRGVQESLEDANNASARKWQKAAEQSGQ